MIRVSIKISRPFSPAGRTPPKKNLAHKGKALKFSVYFRMAPMPALEAPRLFLALIRILAHRKQIIIAFIIMYRLHRAQKHLDGRKRLYICHICRAHFEIDVSSEGKRLPE